MKKQFIIAFLILTVTCVAQDDKKGTVKVKVPETKPVVFTNPDIMPVFEGGNQAMYVFIQKNINYPEVEKKEGIQGTAYVTFVVDSLGSISDVKLLRGVSGGPGCDAEALRVISMLSKWTPGQKNGKNVAVQVNLPIKFIL